MLAGIDMHAQSFQLDDQAKIAFPPKLGSSGSVLYTCRVKPLLLAKVPTKLLTKSLKKVLASNLEQTGRNKK